MPAKTANSEIVNERKLPFLKTISDYKTEQLTGCGLK